MDLDRLDTIFPKDALGAVCYEALARVVAPFDPGLAFELDLQSSIVAHSLGCCSDSRKPPAILRLSRPLRNEFQAGWHDRNDDSLEWEV